MENEYKEYVTFHVTAKDGSDVELAVVEEFDFEHRHYVAGALIQDDQIMEDGVYIYRCAVKDDDFTVEKITDADEYHRVTNAYLKMEE